MVIQNLYDTGSSSIISVGYTDISTGKSRTNLYAGLISGAATAAGLGRDGIISNVPFYSEAIYTESSDSSQPLNFDMDFDIPQRIQGQTIVQIPCFTNSSYVSFNVQLFKMSNGVVTGMLSGATSKYINTGVSGSYLIYMGDVPLTAFKNGDKMRLRIQGTRGTAEAVWVGCDPMDRGWGFTNDSTPTKLIIQTPFKIDL